MFPSIKKNLFQDKVENQKATFGIGMKRALLGLVIGSVVSFASTTIPSSTVESATIAKQEKAQHEFVLESSTSPITVASHESHSSHSSHSSHYSSRY
jgi:hypothetical protein